MENGDVNSIALEMLSFYVDDLSVFYLHAVVIDGEKAFCLFADESAHVRLLCDCNGDKLSQKSTYFFRICLQTIAKKSFVICV